MKCKLCGEKTTMTARDATDNLLHICLKCLNEDRARDKRHYTFSCAYKEEETH